AMGIGLAGRVLMPDLLASGDPELALPYLSLKLLPVVLVGLMLAGLFSATMSTADSQILSCSAALTQDIFPAAAKSYQFAKVGTLTVTAVVLAIALLGNNNVFALVTFSWSALASGLGPLLILRVWQRPVNLTTAIAMMGIGIATALIWNLGLDLSSAIYEVLPGMAAGMAVYGIAQFLKHPK
ncbi:MAG: sodium/proline symporter, partial [Moorea sp. SIO4G2]|nr:sodium/proline symporter [Moorena sp. SIO4G2]